MKAKVEENKIAKSQVEQKNGAILAINSAIRTGPSVIITRPR